MFVIVPLLATFVLIVPIKIPTEEGKPKGVLNFMAPLVGVFGFHGATSLADK
jgi:hypothetical protein